MKKSIEITHAKNGARVEYKNHGTSYYARNNTYHLNHLLMNRYISEWLPLAGVEITSLNCEAFDQSDSIINQFYARKYATAKLKDS